MTEVHGYLQGFHPGVPLQSPAKVAARGKVTRISWPPTSCLGQWEPGPAVEIPGKTASLCWGYHSSLRFGNDLHISNKLFVLDAGASGSKDMKVLRNHLQEIRSQIVSVSIAGEGGNPAFAQPVWWPLNLGLFMLPSWFGFQGTQYEVAVWTCFYPIALGWARKSREARRWPREEGVVTGKVDLRVSAILTVLVICLKVKLLFTNYKNNSKVTYCEIFRKYREVETSYQQRLLMGVK